MAKRSELPYTRKQKRNQGKGTAAFPGRKNYTQERRRAFISGMAAPTEEGFGLVGNQEVHNDLAFNWEGINQTKH